MWTVENRKPGDLTDEEWSLIEPLIRLARHGGRRREVDVRQVLNGITYVLSTRAARPLYRCAFDALRRGGDFRDSCGLKRATGKAASRWLHASRPASTEDIAGW